MTFGARNEVSSKKSESVEANNRILGRAGSSIVRVTENSLEAENSQTRQNQEDSGSKSGEDK